MKKINITILTKILKQRNIVTHPRPKILLSSLSPTSGKASTLQTQLLLFSFQMFMVHSCSTISIPPSEL